MPLDLLNCIALGAGFLSLLAAASLASRWGERVLARARRDLNEGTRR